MDTLTWTRIDKLAAWGDGPWEHEPDKMQWQDEATGLPCMVLRNFMGVWCGYVGVTEGHPWYQVEYDGCPISCKEEDCDHRLDMVLRVHGGLTFSSSCQEVGPMEKRICHVPGHGEPDNVWWFGFDCGHAFDFIPEFEVGEVPRLLGEQPDLPNLMAQLSTGRDRFGLPVAYRTLDYVREQCVALARQLADVV